MASDSDTGCGHEEWPLLQPHTQYRWEKNAGTDSGIGSSSVEDLTKYMSDHGDLRNELDDDASSTGAADDSYTVDQEASRLERPYTSFLGPPRFPSTPARSTAEINTRRQSDYIFRPPRFYRSQVSDLSVISDAGDQQYQKQLALPSTEASWDESEDDESLDSPISYSSTHQLQSSILDAQVPTIWDKSQSSRFLPKGKLCHLIHFDTVKRELTEKLPNFEASHIEHYCHAVCDREKIILDGGEEKYRSFRKIFALLVLVELTETVIDFVDNNVSDLDLPLKNVGTLGKPDLRRMNRDGGLIEGRLRCFKHSKWGPTKLLHFEEKQWTVLAPYFSQSEDESAKHYILHDQHILPFTSLDTTKDYNEYYGGFAKVFTVHIHKDHHDFPDKALCDVGFAVKQLKKTDRGKFKKEVKILKKFSGAHSHPHVVSLLASYEHLDQFHFIFHRAEGNLFEYWNTLVGKPALNCTNVSWMVMQCAGIAEGLGKLHRHLTLTLRQRIAELPREHTNKEIFTGALCFYPRTRSDSVQSDGARIAPASPTFAKAELSVPELGSSQRPIDGDLIEEERFGRHGDISPGNILWYKGSSKPETELSGVLKLSDFGEAELNSRFSRTRKGDVAATMTYRPPECDFPPQFIRQSYDIWCLGCVFLELVTWMLGGAELLQKFVLFRKTKDPFPPHGDTDIFFDAEKDPETGQLQPILKQRVTQFIEERLHPHPKCSDFFHDMLHLIHFDMLLVDQSRRKSCDGVSKALTQMHKRCVVNEEYAITGKPWCDIHLLSPRQ